MLIILLIFSLLFSFGVYMIMEDLLKFPDIKASKAVLSISRREKKKTHNVDFLILELSTKLSKRIKINDYKKRKLIAILKSAEINLTPETYITKAYVKAGMVLLSIIPALFILPMIILAIIFLVVAKYEEDIEREISKRCYEFKSKIESGNIDCEILKQQDIVRLCNLINNPSYTNIEDSEVEATIPIF